MKDRASERYPACLPLSHRVVLRLRKLARQTLVRWQEAAARRQGRLTGDACETRTPSPEALAAPNPTEALNKCSRWVEEDLARPDIKTIADRLVALKGELTRRGLRFTNTAANFLPREYRPAPERTKLWENAWVIRHTEPRPGQTVLDVGGASTLFSFYLASVGCRVVVVDNDWSNCGTIYNARYVARRMGWDLRVLDHDVARALPFPDEAFDRVYSICVLEHLPSAVRQGLLREVGRVLARGGLVGLTCDYDRARPLLITDRGLRFADRAKLERDVIRPSGLRVLGNDDWLDACPKEGFLGALFLQK